MKFGSANDQAKLCMCGYSSQSDQRTGRKVGPVVHANDCRALKKKIWSEHLLRNMDIVKSKGVGDMNLAARSSKLLSTSANGEAKLERLIG